MTSPEIDSVSQAALLHTREEPATKVTRRASSY